MSLSIRLSRGGAKKRPFYRIVVADTRAPRDGRFIEKLGTYNPMLQSDDENRVTLKQERIKYWLGVGAKPSSRVHRFLAKVGMLDSLSIPKQTKKDQPKAKAQERLREEEEALKKDSASNKSAAPEVASKVESVEDEKNKKDDESIENKEEVEGK